MSGTKMALVKLMGKIKLRQIIRLIVIIMIVWAILWACHSKNSCSNFFVIK